MANTQKYLNHLLQNTGITPACSEEERAAADIVATIFKNHGFEPEVQEFTASSSAKMAQAFMGIVVFVGAVLMGIGGALGIVGLLLALLGAVLFVLERTGHPVLSNIGNGGLSQNVIAYHKASGPLASPRNRPVVIVAHYDSPRADLLSQVPYVGYRPLLVKLLPLAMMAPAILALVRIFPVPGAAKVVLWLIAVVVALVPLIQSVAIIANKFVLPYTSGSVCNKSSVAAMLGVMDAVSPYQGVNEFPDDMPFDEYMAEQQRMVAEAAMDSMTQMDEEAVEELEQAPSVPESPAPSQTSALPVPVDPEPIEMDREDASLDIEDPGATMEMSVDGIEVLGLEVDAADSDGGDVDDDAIAGGDDDIELPAPLEEESTAPVDLDAQEPAVEPESSAKIPLNASGNIRYGSDVLRALGMVPDSCVFAYDADALPVVEPESSSAIESTPESSSETTPESDATSDLVADDELDYGESDEELLEEESYDEAEGAWIEADEDGWQESDYHDDDSVFPDLPEEPMPYDADQGASLDFIVEAEYEVIEEEPPSDTADPVGDEDPASDDEGTVVFEAVQDQAVENETVDPSAEPDAKGDASNEAESKDMSQDTHVFDVASASVFEKTQAMPPVQPQQKADTVDSLMAQISQPAPRPQRDLNIPSMESPAQPRRIPSVPGIEALQQPSVNRTPLFDLPDPSVAPSDPFAAVSPSPASSAASRGFSVVTSSDVSAAASQPAQDGIETISAPLPTSEKPRRGLGKLFGRKKKQQESMSDWLGIDSDFDAKKSGGEIGSWDNFDDDSWKGGATGADGVSDAELRDAITSMGDDELLGHDIWFVATGASECGNAGIKAFLNTHRDKLRGVFLINLECVGSGQIAMVATEGEGRVLKGDKRIMKLVQRVSSDFHHEFGSVDMPYTSTDAYAAMSMSLRSLTVAGIDGPHFACSHTEEDQPFNVDDSNVAKVADVVTEVIRRS